MDWIKDRESDKPWAIMVGHAPPVLLPGKKYQLSIPLISSIQKVPLTWTTSQPGSKSDWIPGTGSMGRYSTGEKVSDESPEAVKDFANMVRAYWGTLISVDDSVGRLYKFLKTR